MSNSSQSGKNKEDPQAQKPVLMPGGMDNRETAPKPIILQNGVTLLRRIKAHTNSVTSVAWSPDGRQLVSGSSDEMIHLWNPNSVALLCTLAGHTNVVTFVAWSPDGEQVASSSSDETVRLWNPQNGHLLHTLVGHTHWVNAVTWSPDSQQLASSSYDGTIRVWQRDTGILLKVFPLYGSMIQSISWSPNGLMLAAGMGDGTIQLINAKSGNLQDTFKDHVSAVNAVAWSPGGQQIASGSDDRTIRLRDLKTGARHTLEGHMSRVRDIAWSCDGKLLLSSSEQNSLSSGAEIFVWRADTLEVISALKGVQNHLHAAWHPRLPLVMTGGWETNEIALWRLNLQTLLKDVPSPEMVYYTNAKVVLVGETGVGKSGLGLVLSGQSFIPTESTHGRYVWTFDNQEVSSPDEKRKETRETLLWDLAGQPGYRLIHQLHLNEVTVALVVFDARNADDPFAGVEYWSRALRTAQSLQGKNTAPLKKFLVEARTDRGGVGVSTERIQAIVSKLGFDRYFKTSAKEGTNIHSLRSAISEAIYWEELSHVISTRLFQQIKEFLLEEKQHSGILLSTVEEMYRALLRSGKAPPETPDLFNQFEACLDRVEATGLLKRLSFGNLVLLQPELLDAYASALVISVQEEPDGMGSIAEEQVRKGNFNMPKDERLADHEMERLLLIAMIEDFLRRELALREDGVLVFPSQSTKEHPGLPDLEDKSIILGFEGPTLNIYATLIVRLANSGLFKKKELWKNAIVYSAFAGGECSLYLNSISDGRGELTLFFDKAVSEKTQQEFEEYVRQHLLRRALAGSVHVRRLPVCSDCGFTLQESAVHQLRARDRNSFICPVCTKQILLFEHDSAQYSSEPSSNFRKIDQAADAGRDRQAAKSILEGKIATGDFDVFLCHHGIDKPIVKRIGKQLQEHGILPWLDEWELRPGFPWQQLLEEKIGQIKSAAVFVGKDGIGPWHQQELAAFLREFVTRNCPVIPVLLPSAPKEPGLPRFLNAMTWVDFRSLEPYSEQPFDPIQWQRLLWGITGKRDGGEGG